MEYVLTKKERAIVEAEVTIDGEVWAKAQKKSFNKLANIVSKIEEEIKWTS